jgi:ATP-binding cassette subfamily B protein
MRATRAHVSPSFPLGGDEERVEYDLGLALRLLWYLRPYGWLGLISLTVMALDAVLDALGPYLTKVAIDEHIAKGDLEGLWTVVLLYLGCSGAGAITQFLRVYFLQLTGQKAIMGLRLQIFGHLLRLPASWHDKTPVGTSVSRAVSDVEAIQELFTQGVIVVIGDILALLAIVAALFWLDLRLALVTLAVVPPLALATLIYRRKARRAYRELRSTVAKVNAFLQENLSGIRTVQLLGLEERNGKRFKNLNMAMRDQHIRSIKYTSIFFPFVEVMGALALGTILLYGGGRALQGQIELGVLVAFIQYMKRFFQPVRDLAEKYNLLQAAMAASERVFEVLDLRPQEGPSPRLGQPPGGRGEILARDLWFAYKPGEWVLRGVDFRVEASQVVALVGATGAGKSSLIGLFNRLYEPQKGEILVDGLDIRAWPLDALRMHVAVIPQDVFLFRGTLLENVTFWRRHGRLEDVEEVAREMGIGEWIKGLPRGYETMLDERGQNLSLGQRQLLAFLRALLYDPKILVLDEATSAVDPFTESLLMRAMERLTRGRTCIIIAHRLSTVRRADKILVLHRGKIVEEGTHLQLLGSRGLYWRLHKHYLGSPPGDWKEMGLGHGEVP